MKINPILAVDAYKVSHYVQYEKGTEKVYANWTARSAKNFNWKDFDGEVVFFGLQAALHKIISSFRDDFFTQPLDSVLASYKKRMDTYLGKDSVSMFHIEALHKLGFLPIKIMALPEGTPVPVGVPMFTIENTIPEFFWITNYIESWLSAELWKPCTSATIARQYYKIVNKYCELTGGARNFLPFQCHDFSFRGMSCIEDAAKSGAAHLIYFNGTDTIPAIDFVEHNYYLIDQTIPFLAASIPATEHSISCASKKENERETLRRLITEVYPKGLMSFVSDTWDYFNVLTNIAPSLKEEIMSRDGKVVFRPDSGIPELIICGDKTKPEGSNEYKGSIQILWEQFGGTVNDKGYKVLDSHVGLIYGDSITLERADTILKTLMEQGFASTNVCFGVGSFSYQYVTRDTFGFALKTTYVEVNGEGRDIFKDPVTDNGTKKSLCGRIAVIQDVDTKKLIALDRLPIAPSSIQNNLHEEVYFDGSVCFVDFDEVKDNARGE